MNNRASVALTITEWLNRQGYTLQGPFITDLMSGDIGDDNWNTPGICIRTTEAATTTAPTGATEPSAFVTHACTNMVNALVPQGLQLVQGVGIFPLFDQLTPKLIFRMQGITNSAVTVYFMHGAWPSKINVDTLRMRISDISTEAAQTFPDKFWGATSRKFQLIDPGAPSTEDTLRAQTLVERGWSMPEGQLGFVGLGQHNDEVLQPLETGAFPTPTGPNIQVQAADPWALPAAPMVPAAPMAPFAAGQTPGIDPMGVLTPLMTPPVQVDILPSPEELAKIAQLKREAQETQNAEARKQENERNVARRVQQRQVLITAERARIEQLSQVFLRLHMTTDERIAEAPGQDIPERAHVYDPQSQGFGVNGWQ